MDGLHFSCLAIARLDSPASRNWIIWAFSSLFFMLQNVQSPLQAVNSSGTVPHMKLRKVPLPAALILFSWLGVIWTCAVVAYIQLVMW